jgi:hypothetical protein
LVSLSGKPIIVPSPFREKGRMREKQQEKRCTLTLVLSLEGEESAQ